MQYLVSLNQKNNALRFLYIFMFSFFSLFSQEKKHTIYFETDLSLVSGIETNRLLSFLMSLGGEEISRIEIYGFCDDVGASSYNLTLSQKRAEKIKEILLSNEISNRKITNVDGKGELLLKTVKTTNPDRIRALNRRVELTVSFSVLGENTEKPFKKGNSLVIENLLFLTGYSYLTPGSKKSLDVALEKIKNQAFSFIIQGHVCCTSGQNDAIDRATKRRNLSFVRAKFVYDYFISKGVDPKRMSFEGLGHRFPLGGRSEADRRVEILITSDF